MSAYKKKVLDEMSENIKKDKRLKDDDGGLSVIQSVGDEDSRVDKSDRKETAVSSINQQSNNFVRSLDRFSEMIDKDFDELEETINSMMENEMKNFSK